MNTPIELKGDLARVPVEMNVAALEVRDQLIASAQAVEAVYTDQQQRVAVDTCRDLKAAVKQVEDTRKLLKGPVMDLGKRIDTVAKDFVTPLDIEIFRLGRMITAYTVEQERKAQEAERARQAELARLERERAAAEAAMVFADTENEASNLAAQADQAGAMVMAVLTAAMPAPPVKVAGTRHCDVPRYDVTDVLALVQARPDLCDIAPSKSRIAEAIKGGMTACPGLANIRIEKEVRV
jgi:hypothetical protein